MIYVLGEALGRTRNGRDPPNPSIQLPAKKLPEPNRGGPLIAFCRLEGGGERLAGGMRYLNGLDIAVSKQLF